MSKEKYERLKEKAYGWRSKAIEYEGEIERLNLENEEMAEKVQEFNDNYNCCTEDFEHKIEILQTSNNELQKQIKEFYKDMAKSDFNQEKIILKKDTEIDRLRSSLDDYKERYKEVREDNKDLRKLSRNS